jgi:MFS family permease
VLRIVAILALLLFPLSQLTLYVFAAVMGLLWLGTVPLTSGLVGHIFGLRYMGMLYGIVFLGHQIGGFLGAWLGGRIFDLSGSYLIAWWLSIALSVMAAALSLPVREAPLLRAEAR